VLLLNITAPNPTSRRYSSEMPITTGQGSTAQIGLSGERVLSKDLSLPNNNDPDQRQCICNSPGRVSPAQCRVCIAYSQSVANHRIPDFITPSFIADSKNVLSLPYTDTSLVNQIGDYAIAARSLNIPLYIYVRTNTEVDPEITRIVGETGGGIIYYFTVDGYVDPVDQAALFGLLASLGVFALGGLWTVVATPPNIGGATRVKKRTPQPPPAPKPAPKSVNKPNKTNKRGRRSDVEKAIYMTEATEDLFDRLEDKSREDIDEEDTRRDDDL